MCGSASCEPQNSCPKDANIFVQSSILGDTRLWVGPRIEHLLSTWDLARVFHQPYTQGATSLSKGGHLTKELRPTFALCRGTSIIRNSTPLPHNRNMPGAPWRPKEGAVSYKRGTPVDLCTPALSKGRFGRTNLVSQGSFPPHQS